MKRCCCMCEHADNCKHACEGQLGCKQEGCQPCRAYDKADDLPVKPPTYSRDNIVDDRDV